MSFTWLMWTSNAQSLGIESHQCQVIQMTMLTIHTFRSYRIHFSEDINATLILTKQLKSFLKKGNTTMLYIFLLYSFWPRHMGYLLSSAQFCLLNLVLMQSISEINILINSL